MAKNAQYYQTESELAKLFAPTGLPPSFISGFIKDYAAVKRTVDGSDASLEELQQEVDSLDGRVESAETDLATINSNISSLNSQILDLDGRLDLIEFDVPIIRDDLDAHIANESAHGATGNIVGTDDYCTASVGGTVLQATSIASSAASILSIANTPSVAPVAYSQADAATWVAMLNEIKSDFNIHITEFNALLDKVNAIINTQVVAKQRSL